MKHWMQFRFFLEIHPFQYYISGKTKLLRKLRVPLSLPCLNFHRTSGISLEIEPPRHRALYLLKEIWKILVWGIFVRILLQICGIRYVPLIVMQSLAENTNGLNVSFGKQHLSTFCFTLSRCCLPKLYIKF